MAGKLKACPFCGCAEPRIIFHDRDGKEVSVQCPCCYASTGVDTTEKAAINSWNRRAKNAKG